MPPFIRSRTCPSGTARSGLNRGQVTYIKNLVRFRRENDGQDLIEYALLAAFISLAVVAGTIQLGVSLDDWYTAVANFIDTAPKSHCSGTGIAASDGKCL